VQCAIRSEECPLRIADCRARNALPGVWSARCGLWSTSCGVRRVDCGMPTAECDVRNAGCGVRNAQCGVRNANCRVRNAGCKVLETTPEHYIQIVPLKNTNHTRISRTNQNPLQRIKVSNGRTLFALASYLKRLEGSDGPARLHAPFRNETVQVLLLMSVAMFLFITTQQDQGKLRDTVPVMARTDWACLDQGHLS